MTPATHVRGFLRQWRRRRYTRDSQDKAFYQSVRHVVGPTGNLFSNGWETFEQGRAAYMRSFDPRVPPSIHISQRERDRATLPVPLVERCVEDWQAHQPPR